MLKAWVVYHAGENNLSIVAATSRGKARSIVYRSARDAGYDLDWSEFWCKRASKFDINIILTDVDIEWYMGYCFASYSIAGEFEGYRRFGCLVDSTKPPIEIYRELGCKPEKSEIAL